MYLPHFKFVALPVPELIGVAKNWGGPCICPHFLFSFPPKQKKNKNSICLPYDYFIHMHSFSRDFRLQFLVRVANPQFWGRGGRKRSGIVPFEKALVSSYRPSIVTFPLSLRVSEISPLLFSSTHFSLPTSSLPKISPCSLGIGG